MSFTAMLNQKADVARITTAVDAIGGSEETETTPYEDIPCRLDVLSSSERAMSGSQGVEVTHRMFCGAGFTINDTDTVTVSSTVYEVVHAADTHGHHMEIMLKERRPAR